MPRILVPALLSSVYTTHRASHLSGLCFQSERNHRTLTAPASEAMLSLIPLSLCPVLGLLD